MHALHERPQKLDSGVEMKATIVSQGDAATHQIKRAKMLLNEGYFGVRECESLMLSFCHPPANREEEISRAIN